MRVRDLTSAGTRFVTTRWSLVWRAAEGGNAGAMDEFARLYWPPVHAYFMAKGRQGEEANDLAQGFFADVVLGRRLLRKATGGRLRHLILASLGNYLVDRIRHDQTRGRDGRVSGIDPMVAARVIAAQDAAAADVFEGEWDLAHAKEAVRRCREYWTSRGKAGHWEMYEERVIRPLCGLVGAATLAECAARYGFGGPADAAAAVQAVKKRMQAIVDEIAGA